MTKKCQEINRLACKGAGESGKRQEAGYEWIRPGKEKQRLLGTCPGRTSTLTLCRGVWPDHVPGTDAPSTPGLRIIGSVASEATLQSLQLPGSDHVAETKHCHAGAAPNVPRAPSHPSISQTIGLFTRCLIKSPISGECPVISSDVWVGMPGAQRCPVSTGVLWCPLLAGV